MRIRSSRDSLPTRREFLTTASCAMAGVMVNASSSRSAKGMLVFSGDSALPASAWISLPDASLLRALAMRAIDAARQAGASYADVRIADWHKLYPGASNVGVELQCAYGVRAYINGAWGFAYGRIPTPDAIIATARTAVSAAQVVEQANMRTMFRRSISMADSVTKAAQEWVPGPVVRGEWQTPMMIDPFDVPCQQHAELYRGYRDTARRLPESWEAANGMDVSWLREVRVLASTRGTLVTQRRSQALISTGFRVQYGGSMAQCRVPGFEPVSGGYEVLARPELHDRIKETQEQALVLARLPMRTLDVGRYPVVADGYMTGQILMQTLGPALELDRVLGEHVGTGGTSPFTVAQLGASVASPLLTLSGHRAFPSVTCVQWDDDGWVPAMHTLIQDGTLVDYHTSGQTVAALNDYYRQRGKPAQANGCATADQVQDPVGVTSPHLVMTPGVPRLSFTDLYKDMAKGIVILYQNSTLSTDQGLSSGSMRAGIQGFDGMVFEVTRGQLVRRIKGMTLQFNTIPLFKGMTAIGDATTVRQQAWRMPGSGMPWKQHLASADAPAALFKEMSLVAAQ